MFTNIEYGKVVEESDLLDVLTTGICVRRTPQRAVSVRVRTDKKLVSASPTISEKLRKGFRPDLGVGVIHVNRGNDYPREAFVVRHPKAGGQVPRGELWHRPHIKVLGGVDRRPRNGSRVIIKEMISFTEPHNFTFTYVRFLDAYDE